MKMAMMGHPHDATAAQAVEHKTERKQPLHKTT
jgi:hypothetical protein